MGQQNLVADVGGTNTRVALAIDGKLQTQTIHRYRNTDQSGVFGILQKYLSEHAPEARPEEEEHKKAAAAAAASM